MSELCRETIRKIAIQTHKNTWDYFSKENISQDEVSQMLENAFTSLNLWTKIGSHIQVARGHWMLSRAYCVAKNKEQALYHAEKCKAFTENANEGKYEFDTFYYLEALARANVLSENFPQAESYFAEAMGFVEKIEDKETKDLCLSDLKSAPWFGVDFF